MLKKLIFLTALAAIPLVGQAGYAVIDLGPKNYNSQTEASVNLDASVGGTSSTETNNQNSSETSISDGQVLRFNRAQVNTEIESQTSTEVSAELPRATVEPNQVETNGDLELYVRGVIERDEAVEEMNFTGESVEVKYRQQGKLLALIPVNFVVKATARANGEVELDYPWYAFATVDNQNEIETELKVAVDNALRAKALGSVRAEGEAQNPRFSASQSAEVAAQIQAVLRSNLASEGEEASSAAIN